MSGRRNEIGKVKQSIHTGCIDTFGIRFDTSIMRANDFTIEIFSLNAFCYFERQCWVVNDKARFAYVEAQKQNEVHYGDEAESAWDLKAYVLEKLTTIAELRLLPKVPRYADRKK